MSAETIARALGGASKGTNGWWSAKCPAHEDGKASLGLHDTDDGGVAWKCMAGCDSKAVGDALKAEGLLPERPKRERKAKAKPARSSPPTTTRTRTARCCSRWCATSRRTSGSGGPTRTARRAGSGASATSRRPLYRLPELLAADPAEPVFLVEGEKDVDRLRSLGLTATTTAQGADNWSKTDHSAARRPPCRHPARQRRRRAASTPPRSRRDLAGKAASVRLLSLPGLPPKGDVSRLARRRRHRRRAAPARGTRRRPTNRSRPSRTSAEDGDEPTSERWNDSCTAPTAARRATSSTTSTLILRNDTGSRAGCAGTRCSRPSRRRTCPGARAAGPPGPTPTISSWPMVPAAARLPEAARPAPAAVQIVARDLHAPSGARAAERAGLGRHAAARARWLTDLSRRGATSAYATRGRAARGSISAVARVIEPGCKADHALILEGAAGRRQEHRRRDPRARARPGSPTRSPTWAPRTAAQDLRGKWIVELAELSAHEARRGRARQGVHVPPRRPLPADLRHALAGLPAPVRVHRHDQRRRLPRRRDRQPALLAGARWARSTSRRCGATATSSGPRPWPPTGPARTGGSTAVEEAAREEQEERRIVRRPGSRTFSHWLVRQDHDDLRSPRSSRSALKHAKGAAGPEGAEPSRGYS